MGPSLLNGARAAWRDGKVRSQFRSVHTERMFILSRVLTVPHAGSLLIPDK